jgi:hypothetical protein
MKNEINDPTNLAERLSKFDRELNPSESIKDNAILRHITRQTQLKHDLAKLDSRIGLNRPGFDGGSNF